MKKIFFSVLAIAAIAACTKSEVQYDAPQEIGFSVVAGNITKSVVNGNLYPKTLDMYVFAETTDNTDEDANYINNAPFAHRDTKVEGIDVWGGKNQSFYWPNVKTLHFAGYSDAGNATGSYDCQTGVFTMDDYTPKKGSGANAEGANDLMWFPSTELTQAAGYGKGDAYVPVYMYHTCAWITFIVKGEGVTIGKYTVTDLAITNIDQTADVSCSATCTDEDYNNIVPNIQWSNNGDNTVADGATEEDKQAIIYTVVSNAGILLDGDGKDVETNAAYVANPENGGNIVVIPQSLPFPTTTDGVKTYSAGPKITLKYKYESPASTVGNEIFIEEEISDLPLTIDDTTSDNNKWEPGKHYVYTITIKANEILIAPSVPVDWVDGTPGNVTVE